MAFLNGKKLFFFSKQTEDGEENQEVVMTQS